MSHRDKLIYFKTCRETYGLENFLLKSGMRMKFNCLKVIFN